MAVASDPDCWVDAQTPIITKGLGLGGWLSIVNLGAEYDDASQEKTIGILSVVTVSDDYVPLTGSYAVEEDLGGWLYDRHRAMSLIDDKTKYKGKVGSIDLGLDHGTQKLDWQSGTISGLSYLQTKSLWANDREYRAPEVTLGRYAVHDRELPLFSDYSYSEIAEPTSSEVSLRTDCIESTIEVTLYERREGITYPYRQWSRVEEFTGEFSGGSRVSAGDDPNLASDRVWEYILGTDKITFNQDPAIKIGDVSDTIGGCDPEFYDFLGYSSGNGRICKTRLFPIESSSFTLWYEGYDGDLVQLTEVTDLNFTKDDDYYYEVDYDLGRIRVGGRHYGPVHLREAISDTDTTIPVSPGDNFQRYPEQGIITIGSETITYYEKGKDAFYECIRGNDSTTAASHSKGAEARQQKHGKSVPPTNRYFAKYTATPRLEYEVESGFNRTANSIPWVDVRPSLVHSGTGILQLQTTENDIKKAVLDVDFDKMAGNLYGPIYYRDDVAKVTVMVTDYLDRPVNDVQASIEVVSGVGKFENSRQEIAGTTNRLGQFSGYLSVYNEQDMTLNVTDVSHDGADTIMTVESLPEDLSLQDVWLFQELKHDESYGAQGLESTTEAAASSMPPWGNTKFWVPLVLDGSYEGGQVKILHTDGVKRIYTIMKINYEERSDKPGTWVYLDVVITPADIDTQSCWFFRENALLWDETKDGVRVVPYVWSGTAEHPITGSSGAYVPVQPDAKSDNTLTFSGVNLPKPAPDDPTNNLASYEIITSSITKCIANIIDPVSGRVVSTNTVRLLLKLPIGMTGVDFSGVSPVPRGFTFVTDDVNVGTRFGGANFFTVNPKTEGTGLLTLQLET